MTNGEIGKAASGFIDAMKSQPLALALCVMNIALLAIMFYENKGYAAARQASVTQVLEHQKEMQRLLAQCATDRRSDYIPSEEHTI